MDEEVDRLLGADPPPPPGSMARDKGVLLGCILLHVAARPGYPQVDNGRAGGPIPPCTIPRGENPVYVEPFPVWELVHMEDDIKWAVKWLQNHRSEGPSGIRADHLKGWLAEARKEESARDKTAATEGAAEVLGGTGGE